MSVKNITKLATIAALYAVLTIFLPYQFGPIQFRLAEALNFLIFYDYRYIYALGIGCAIANIFASPMKLDVFVGTTQTVVILFLIYFLTKNMHKLITKYLTLDIIFSLSMFIIAWELWVDNLITLNNFWPTYFGLIFWEAFVLTITGIAMYVIQKRQLIDLSLD